VRYWLPGGTRLLQRPARVGKQAEETSPLDGLADSPLLDSTGAESLARVDLTVGRQDASEVVNVLVIDPWVAPDVIADNLGAAGTAVSGRCRHGVLLPRRGYWDSSSTEHLPSATNPRSYPKQRQEESTTSPCPLPSSASLQTFPKAACGSLRLTVKP
jgi:hypothetical protein